MRNLKEISIALTKILIGMIIMIEALTALVFINHISIIGSQYNDRITFAYDTNYETGYSETYDIGYKKAYDEAYENGYRKGYEINRETLTVESTARKTELHNPTYVEMKEFLARDETDANPFISGQYICCDFAAQVNNNAEANGIRTAYVRIRANKWGHVVIAFATTDRGLIFIEPQSDREAKIIIGERYPWYEAGAVSPIGYQYPIEEIQIIW
ncbi:MAG: hypothetical protein PHQ86_01140 [Dehalococcoidales bacterium]|nr:hypothetical protein [Dehalococcoidales bacterium]